MSDHSPTDGLVDLDELARRLEAATFDICTVDGVSHAINCPDAEDSDAAAETIRFADVDGYGACICMNRPDRWARELRDWLRKPSVTTSTVVWRTDWALPPYTSLFDAICGAGVWATPARPSHGGFTAGVRLGILPDDLPGVYVTGSPLRPIAGGLCPERFDALAELYDASVFDLVGVMGYRMAGATARCVREKWSPERRTAFAQVCSAAFATTAAAQGVGDADSEIEAIVGAIYDVMERDSFESLADTAATIVADQACGIRTAFDLAAAVTA